MGARFVRALVPSLLASALLLSAARADDPADSPGGAPHRVHALVGATVVPRPGLRLERATVILRDGLIEAVGEGVLPPADARVWDANGLTIYPGLIEPHLPLVERGDASEGEGPQTAGPPEQGARHANPKVRPERRAVERLALEPERLRALRAAGFTAALVTPGEGIVRGTSALVTLRDGASREQVIAADVAHHLAFEQAGWGVKTYPHSRMGAVALVRQTLVDAEHYLAAWSAYRRSPLGQERPQVDVSLAALAPALEGTLPVCVEAEDEQALLRSVRVLREFELVPWVVLGHADGRWLDEVIETAAPLILSVNFPPPPRWESEDEALEVEGDALRAWHYAPEVPAALERGAVRFALTSHGLTDRARFRARVRQAIERGLSEDAALAAFTTAPAALLRAPQLGVIAPGAIANLTVCDGPLWGEHSRVVETWVDGPRYPTALGPPAPADLAGVWRLDVPGHPLRVELKHERGALAAKVAPAEGAAAPEASGGAAAEPEWRELDPPQLWRDRLSLRLPGELLGRQGAVALVARVRGRLLRGRLEEQGEAGPERAVRGRLEAPGEDPKGEEANPSAAPVELPTLAAGEWASWPPRPAAAPAGPVLLRGATVWTLGPQGTLEDADLLVEGGRVVQVGYDLQAPGATVVSAAGAHITPGIVDCHSHAFSDSMVNEGTRSCTAEVRLADVIDAETIQIYRQLAGGVTTANLLHGSANPIGGQSAVLQLKWGQPAHALLMAGAPPGIKFALGENPKRSNWGPGWPARYPTSRMGVQESIRERFQAARNYQRQLADWRLTAAADPAAVPPRVDLQLEALSEVLAGKRRVHCHSYRQDEILAMIRLAEEFGFTVGTFQHVLEGYKVADEIAAHGAGASTFSDWWAYKFEVYDAIAHNGALMHDRGVLVSFNSDSAEMARRLNLEAAKAVRYGGLSDEAALALVTLNPARQLGLDHRIGSLEPGKEADFAVWSGHPLQPTSLCLQTWIGGQRLYDRQGDAAAHARGEEERARLLAAARAARFAPGAEDGARWRATFGGLHADAHGEAAHACCGEREGE